MMITSLILLYSRNLSVHGRDGYEYFFYGARSYVPPAFSSFWLLLQVQDGHTGRHAERFTF